MCKNCFAQPHRILLESDDDDGSKHRHGVVLRMTLLGYNDWVPLWWWNRYGRERAIEGDVCAWRG